MSRHSRHAVCDAMPLQIIGAGLGRTGTSSLKDALEILGFPCYHMDVLLEHPEDLSFWIELQQGTRDVGDWDRAFGGRQYSAAIDGPPNHWYKEMAAQFPDAKVILTHREGGKWYDSAFSTIYQSHYSYPLRARLLFLPWWRQFDRHIVNTFWRGHVMRGAMARGRAAAAARVDAWNAEVVAAIPPERLLKFSVEEGWGPLCAFLGVPVPDVPFPRVNDTDAFKHGLVAQKREGWRIIAAGVAAVAALGALAAFAAGKLLRARSSSSSSSS